MNKSTKIFLFILLGLAFVTCIAILTFWMMLKNVERKEVVVFHGSGDEVAVVEVKGVILDSEEIVRQLKKFNEDRSIQAIILRVDSPGGGVAASQEIYEEVRKIRESGKIVVVSMGSMAASGGYYVSCGANKIVANKGTLTGSIGVISQFMEFDSLMGKIGITMNTIKSGKMKDAGNPFRRMTAEDKEYFQSLMDDVHRQFIGVVESERKLDHDTLVKYADGRVFTGEQALELGLVDTLGTYEDAVSIAAELAGISGKPSIVKEAKKRISLFDILTGNAEVTEFIGLKERILQQPILQYRLPQGF
ncbi:MAG: signal peptide peptidase SppA [Bacteroidetes bacterium]|nr:MAG: signal peptide peptidase SppA [Bacteroidota bacterium]